MSTFALVNIAFLGVVFLSVFGLFALGLLWDLILDRDTKH